MSRQRQPPVPTVTSLREWHVGASEVYNGQHEIRLLLDDKDELRAWVTWLLAQTEAADMEKPDDNPF